jgi:glycosyltransferase involved in cell wall biosynthesis
MKEIWVNTRFLTQQISGVQVFAIELCRHLKKINPTIKFVSPTNIMNKKVALELEVITCGKHTGQLWEQFDLPRFLNKRNQPILLNLCNSAPYFYKKNIITIHDLAFIEQPKWFSLSFRTWYKILIPKIAKDALEIITVSEFSKKEILEKLNTSNKKITVVYNGLSEELIQYKNDNKNITREKILLSVGSINPRKNIKTVIKAFEELHPKGYKLIIVGAKNSNFSTEKFTLQNNNIQFSGHLSNEELWDLYRKAEFFIYPSIYEGFGIPILESLFFECPVIASNLEVYKEVYNGLNLTYTNGTESEDFKEMMTSMLTEKTPRLISNLDLLRRYSYKNGASTISQLINNYE